MKKEYLTLFSVHAGIAFVFAIPIYMVSGAPVFDPVQVWLYIASVFFPAAILVSLATLYMSRGEEGNLKYFLITLPIMFLPYLMLLFIMMLM